MNQKQIFPVLILVLGLMAFQACQTKKKTQNISPKETIEANYNKEAIAYFKEKSTGLSKIGKMPEFPGGANARHRYIFNNLVYPNSALEHHIQGTVIVGFIIDKNGDVKDVRIVRGVCHSLDLEAIRLIKNFPRWTPAENTKGEPTDMVMTLPISFRLN